MPNKDTRRPRCSRPCGRMGIEDTIKRTKAMCFPEKNTRPISTRILRHDLYKGYDQSIESGKRTFSELMIKSLGKEGNCLDIKDDSNRSGIELKQRQRSKVTFKDCKTNTVMSLPCSSRALSTDNSVYGREKCASSHKKHALKTFNLDCPQSTIQRKELGTGKGKPHVGDIIWNQL